MATEFILGDKNPIVHPGKKTETARESDRIWRIGRLTQQRKEWQAWRAGRKQEQQTASSQVGRGPEPGVCLGCSGLGVLRVPNLPLC